MNPNGLKQAAALLSLAGMLPADQVDKEVLSIGTRNYSTFYG